MIGLGLGLAIDYTLFLVTRFREELEQQGPGAGAVRTTMNTAGRTVAYSAATVAFALITLTVFPLGFLQSMGIAGAVVALVAGLAALVISPTVFALWGAKLAVRRRRPERPPEQGALVPAGARGHAPPAARGRHHRGADAAPRAARAARRVWTPVDSSVIPKGQSSRTVADTLDARVRRARRQPGPDRDRRPRGRARPPSRGTRRGSKGWPACARSPRRGRWTTRPGRWTSSWRARREGDAAQALVAGDPRPPVALSGPRRRRRRGVRRPAGRDRLEPPARRRPARGR